MLRGAFRPLHSLMMDTANEHDSHADLTPDASLQADRANERQSTGAPDAEVASTPPPAAASRRSAAWLTTPGAGWVATALATLVAAAIRLPGLDNVRTLIFDETYYVKDAWSLLTLGYEGTWPKEYDASFVAGDVSGLSTVGGYPVHPPTGKWLIALGMKFFGQADPVGWRITAAICGIVTVFLLCRLAHNLFRSPALTLLAGVFLATDGMAIVMSRTAILDGFLAMFALAAFLCVVKDQQSARRVLTGKLANWDQLGAPRSGLADLRSYLSRRDKRAFAVGPNAGNRPWLVAAGVLTGLACSVKWSGIYVLATLGLFVAFREVTCRWRAGHPSPVRGALLADIWWAFVLMVPTALLTYVASWFGWFAHPAAHGHGRSGIGGFGGALADLWLYHKEMWTFHNNLETPHTYQSNPFTWLVQLRATSFHWATGDEITGCRSGTCATDIVALGNPLLWWVGIGALLLVVWTTCYYRSWRTATIALGYVALYVPWLAYAHRTIFTFYTVVFAPFVALAVAWMVAVIASAVPADGRVAQAPLPLRTRVPGWALATIVTLAIIACALYFLPLWRADVVDYEFWRAHMWLRTWI